MEISEYRAVYPVDLHSHTTRSDGSDTPREFIDRAASFGMKIIVNTDHDIRPAETIIPEGTRDEVSILDYAASKGMRLLRGIEISCETTAEDCHIVCFGCDWNDPFFDELEQSVILSKTESYKVLTERLTQAGMPVSWEEVLDNNGNPVTEDHVQKKMIFELMARKGYTRDWSEAKLMVKNDPALQTERRKPDPCHVIREVHRCGGIAIMAHPYLVNEPVCLPGEKLTREAYIERLIEAGLDGIEARYTYDKTSYGGDLTKEEIEAAVREKYAHRLKIISGGSDYHADFKKGVRNPRMIGEAGLTMEEFMSNPLLVEILEKNAPSSDAG